MELIAHRINTIQALKDLPRQYGVEVDLRDQGGKLILQHDPFKGGEIFENYLKSYRHGTLILNIKSERIEFAVLDLIKKYQIKKYFFLDSSFPMIVALARQGIKNVALRYSEYEGSDTILSFKNKVKWVWVDCFSRLPIHGKNYKAFKKAGLKICLVSPDLQGRVYDIARYKKYLRKNRIVVDAVCTKLNNFHSWKD